MNVCGPGRCVGDCREYEGDTYSCPVFYGFDQDSGANDPVVQSPLMEAFFPTRRSSEYRSLRYQRGPYLREKEPVMTSKRQLKLEQAQRTIERAQERIDRLMSLPEEPTGKGPKVIYFKRKFALTSGRTYTYAAVRAAGLWYTTGPQTPKGYTWDELIEWIADGQTKTRVRIATEWDEL